MPYCCRCGVELDPSVRTCPLCKTPMPQFKDLGTGEPAYPPTAGPSKVYFTGRQLRIRIFWVLTALLLLPVLIVTSVNLLISGAITWSRLPDSVFAASLGYLITGFLFWRRPWVMMFGFFLFSLLLLFLINYSIEARITWSRDFGLPFITLTALLVFLTAWALKKSRRLGYNLFGILAITISVFCLGLDFLISGVFFKGSDLTWSLIVSLALGPFGLFFFLLHYALGRNINLKQTFHF